MALPPGWRRRHSALAKYEQPGTDQPSSDPTRAQALLWLLRLEKADLSRSPWERSVPGFLSGRC